MTTPASSRKRILVVDDDAQMRELVSRALEIDYAVDTATDPTDASTLLTRIPVPDLIVCDVMMPKIDGFRFIEGLKKQKGYERVPVIFLTAKASPLDVVHGINVGARHYVTKPFKLQDLLAKVGKILK
jgi:DNA-binding response OmpR family regulator